MATTPTIWSKDTTSDPPRIIYTPLGENPGLTRIVLDPEAPASRRVTAEWSYLSVDGETDETLDAAFGLL